MIRSGALLDGAFVLLVALGRHDLDSVAIEDAGHFAAFMEPEQFLDELVRRVWPLDARDP